MLHLLFWHKALVLIQAQRERTTVFNPSNIGSAARNEKNKLLFAGC